MRDGMETLAFGEAPSSLFFLHRGLEIAFFALANDRVDGECRPGRAAVQRHCNRDRELDRICDCTTSEQASEIPADNCPPSSGAIHILHWDFFPLLSCQYKFHATSLPLGRHYPNTTLSEDVLYGRPLSCSLRPAGPLSQIACADTKFVRQKTRGRFPICVRSKPEVGFPRNNVLRACGGSHAVVCL